MGDQTKKNEMAGLQHPWKRKGAYRVLRGNLMERDHLEALAGVGRILALILKEIKQGRVDWKDLAQDMDMGQVAVKM
jgi:hypothetical protein